MSGPVLADHALDRRPGLRVLFVSGYAADEVGTSSRLVGQPFLQKPFTPTSLVHCVQEVIGESRTDPVEEAHP
jgi:FixJ family two-component response regulator